MENFRRSNKNSKLANGQDLDSLLNLENEQTQILQIVPMPTNIYGVQTFIVEYIEREGSSEEKNESLKPDLDFQNYLETYINRDPFGGKYSGKMIKEVFEAGDKRWLDTALKEMKNEFIRERLQYIIDRGGYGKINS